MMKSDRAIAPPSRAGRMFRLCAPLLAAAFACRLPQPLARPAQAPQHVKFLPLVEESPLAPAAVITTPPEAPEDSKWTFPTIRRERLRNGLGVHSVQRRGAPLLELRLLIHSGSRSEGRKPGVATLTTQFLKYGGAGSRDASTLAERLGGLGGQLELDTHLDSTQLSLRVPPGQLRPALQLLADIALRPRFDEAAFQALRPHQAHGIEQRLRGDARWAASTAVQQELLGQKLSRNANATLKRTRADCRRWHRRHFSPRNATLLAVGDFDGDSLLAAAKNAFGRWRGRRVRAARRPQPPSGASGRIYIVARPGSAHTEIQVATLGPERGEREWFPAEVLLHALGGGRTSRLWNDLREQRALAFDASCDWGEVSKGPVPLVLRAAASVDTTGDALAGLLEHYSRLATKGVEPEEVEVSQQFLKRSLPLRASTAQSLLEQVTVAARVGLPAEYFSNYSQEIDNLDIEALNAAAKRYFARPPVVVVAGDAERLIQPLRRFGELHVLVPERGFAVDRIEPAAQRDPESGGSQTEAPVLSTLRTN